MSAAATPAYEWKTIPWRTLERQVFKLQTRIYRARGVAMSRQSANSNDS